MAEVEKERQGHRRPSSSSTVAAAATAAAVTTVLPDGDVPDQAREMSEDEAALAQLGYKQEFKREFSAVSISPWSRT